MDMSFCRSKSFKKPLTNIYGPPWRRFIATAAAVGWVPNPLPGVAGRPPDWRVADVAGAANYALTEAEICSLVAAVRTPDPRRPCYYKFAGQAFAPLPAAVRLTGGAVRPARRRRRRGRKTLPPAIDPP